jgi:ABC-2 type transport system permease protein
MNLTPFIALVRKDLILYLSNRRALLLNLLMPIALGGFFGYLFGGSGSTQPSKIQVAVVQQDSSAIGQKLAASLIAEPTFEVVQLSMDEARKRVGKGKLSAALVIPSGFGDAARTALFDGKNKPTLPIMFDPSDSAALGAVRGVTMQHVMRVVSTEAFAGSQNGQGAASRIEIPFSTEMQAVSSNPAQYNGYAHSFGGMAVQFILFMAIDAGIGILLAQKMGLWSRMLAAPVSSNTLLMARLVSSAVISYGIMLAIFAVASLAFNVQVNGSVVGLALLGACFALMAASFGLLVAALGKSPEAARGIASFATIIMVMLGGAWVPSFFFPPWMQSITLFIPTRWAVDGFDAMTWRGLGLESALPAIGVQLGFAIVFGSIALWRMRRT